MRSIPAVRKVKITERKIRSDSSKPVLIFEKTRYPVMRIILSRTIRRNIFLKKIFKRVI
jgi:hypothetical protein